MFIHWIRNSSLLIRHNGRWPIEERQRGESRERLFLFGVIVRVCWRVRINVYGRTDVQNKHEGQHAASSVFSPPSLRSMRAAIFFFSLVCAGDVMQWAGRADKHRDENMFALFVSFIYLFVLMNSFNSLRSTSVAKKDLEWRSNERFSTTSILFFFFSFSHVDPVRRTSDDHLSFLLRLRMQRCAHCTMCRRLSLSLLSFTIDIFFLSFHKSERGSEIILCTLSIERVYVWHNISSIPRYFFFFFAVARVNEWPIDL